MSVDISGQVGLLQRGTTGITPEKGLEQKLERAEKSGKPLVVKLGLDPTAPHIHLGLAVVLRKLRQFQDLGHQVVVVIGDFTAMIGDPSGKSETRKQLTREEVEENARTYAEQYCRILDSEKTIVRFNSEWLGAMDFFDVIRLAARMTVARVMERDDFQTRFRDGRPISVHELLYPLCQAYDSVVLEADIEMGGSDQMFNILAGRDLQVQYGQEPQVALFMPLLVGLDGSQKMSKSLGNYIGITESPDTMFGKVMSISDAMMLPYFELCSDVPMEESRPLVSSALSGDDNPKNVKRRLAAEIVSIYHGAEAAACADAEFERVHARHEMPTEIPVLVMSDELARDGKVWVCKLLTAAGLAKGTGEARRLVEQGGVVVSGRKVTSADVEFDLAELTDAVVQVGSRRFVRLLGQ